MKLLFLVSSIGDTDLAKETISRLITPQSKLSCTLIPLTSVATKRIENFIDLPCVNIKMLSDITGEDTHPTQKATSNQIKQLNQWIEKENMTCAYVGVPSPFNEHLALDLATHFTLPLVIAYEYLFKPEHHAFHEYLPLLAAKPNCRIAVTTNAAAQNIQQVVPAKTEVIGHLAIDKAFASISDKQLKAATRQTLNIQEHQAYAFVSGTTQPCEVDVNLLKAICEELASEKHPNMQVRFGIHPGIGDMKTYLLTLKATVEQYPQLAKQLQIIFSPVIKAKLMQEECPLFETSPFFLSVDVNGANAASSADNVAQAVPGALLNEAALLGKPVYTHQRVVSYLPEKYFSSSLNVFFNPSDAQQEAHHASSAAASIDLDAESSMSLTRKNLMLPEMPAPDALISMLIKP